VITKNVEYGTSSEFNFNHGLGRFVVWFFYTVGITLDWNNDVR